MQLPSRRLGLVLMISDFPQNQFICANYQVNIWYIKKLPEQELPAVNYNIHFLV